MEARSRLLFYVLLFLVGASGAVLMVEHGADRRRQAATQSFQKLVGGLGFGSVAGLGAARLVGAHYSVMVKDPKRRVV